MRLARSIPKRFLFWIFHHTALLVFWVLVALPACWQASTRDWSDDLIDPIPDHAEAQQRRITAHLNAPFEGYARAQILDDNFQIVALSHMAYGYMNIVTTQPDRKEEFSEPVRELVERALDPRVSPFKKRADEVAHLGDYGLYLSHLNLILGVHRHVTGDETYDKFHTRVSKHLAARSRADGDWHARSYPVPKHLAERQGAYKWPADQAALLASLFLYDMTRKKKLSSRPIRRWLAYMKSKKMTHEELGLPLSALDQKVEYARFPRGCALSWTILYMAQFAPEEASALYETYREKYHQTALGFGGFREWPPGVDRGMDVDSGPVILGVGVAATGLGTGPAKLMRDPRQYSLIMRSATTFGAPTLLLDDRYYVTSPLLGEAILFGGTSARVWFGEPPRREPYPEGAPLGSGNIILMIILAALIYYSISSIRENIFEIRAWR